MSLIDSKWQNPIPTHLRSVDGGGVVEGELPVDHVRPQDAELRVLREAEEHRHRELLPRLVEQQLPHRVRLRTLGTFFQLFRELLAFILNIY